MIKDRITDFRRVPASQIEGAPWNWRKHGAYQKAAVKASLEELGIIDALKVRELGPDRYQLWDGHLREAEFMGIGPDTLVPILVTDLSEGEAKKANTIFDPLAAMAEADAGKLDAMLREVETGGEDLAKMLAEPAEIVEDEVPEPPADPFTQPGDLWVMGEHRLLCGDSTKAEDVGRLLAGRKPFIMVTDPPYGVKLDQSWRDKALGSKAMGPGNKHVVQNDDRADWTEVWQLFPGDVAYVWHASSFSDVVTHSLREAGFSICQQLIWNKSVMVMGRSDYHFKHEPCWYAVRKGKTHGWTGDRKQTTVIEAKSPNHIMSGSTEEKTEHPTQKPVECMARPIRNHGGAEDDVYDPFLGSGTTIIAAEQLGRRCFGLEITPAYCDVILTRWSKLTGKTPVRESDGAAFPVQQAEVVHG